MRNTTALTARRREQAVLVAVVVPDNGGKTWREVEAAAVREVFDDNGDMYYRMSREAFAATARALLASGRIERVGYGEDATVRLRIRGRESR